MNKEELTAFLEMLTQNSPDDDSYDRSGSYEVLVRFANEQANQHGYTDWICAYHSLCFIGVEKLFRL